MGFDYDEFCKKLDGKPREEAIAEVAGKLEHFSELLHEATFSTSDVLRSRVPDYKRWKHELTDLYETVQTLKKGEVFRSEDLC